jgi:large subunit ribosomal protein L7/L12
VTNIPEIVESIDKLTVIELAELKQKLEDRLGVTFATPIIVGQMESILVKEESLYQVIFKDKGPTWINVVKILRTMLGLELKTAKEFVDNPPKVIKDNLSKEEATTLRKTFEETGAVVEMKEM